MSKLAQDLLTLGAIRIEDWLLAPHEHLRSLDTLPTAVDQETTTAPEEPGTTAAKKFKAAHGHGSGTAKRKGGSGSSGSAEHGHSNQAKKAKHKNGQSRT
jgi:hypothetical protein